MLPEDIRSRIRANRRRLAKLQPDDSPDADLRRVCVVQTHIQELAGVTEEAAERVWEMFMPWAVEALTLAVEGRDEREDEIEKREQARRVPLAVFGLLSALPVDLRSIAVGAGAFDRQIYDHEAEQWVGETGWACDWVESLIALKSTLPDGLTFETAEQIAEVLENHAAELDDLNRVCTTCGLRIPRRRLPPLSEWRIIGWTDETSPHGVNKPIYDTGPQFFEACPHCGGERLGFEMHMLERGYPWRAAAAQALDLRRVQLPK